MSENAAEAEPGPDPRVPEEWHPALAGRGPESRVLAGALRRLIELSVTTTAPPETTLEAVRGLEAVEELLRPHVPDSPPAKTSLSDPPGDGTDCTARMPYDNVIGRHNPLALPLDLSFDPPRALLEGTFTVPYEGPPGCVHGAVLAASFDIVLAAANVVAGLPGPTAKLEIAYRRPTLLNEPCSFEAQVESQDERRVRTTGRLVQDGRVTVEAAGNFAFLDRAAIARMSRRSG